MKKSTKTFRVIPVMNPVRATNEQLTEFAKNVEKAFNTLHKEEREILPPLIIPGVGVLITGFIPKEETVVNTKETEFLHSVSPMFLNFINFVQSHPVARMSSRAGEPLTEEDIVEHIRKLLEKASMDASQMIALRNECLAATEKHAKECVRTEKEGCMLSLTLRAAGKALEEKLRLSVS